MPPAGTPGFSVVVGLSGGADSVALTHILHRLGYDLRLTHCHFGLRGEESDRDADFCAAYARRLRLPLRTVCFDTESRLRQHRQSIEELCRELRYGWWKEEYLLPAGNAEGEAEELRLCVGHHQDDSIETMLFHLMRGTGIKGLLGIPARNGWVARPLLCLSRTEILEYLKENRLEYITDSSNLENDYTRNKIRNRLLPLMEEINPHARRGIIRSIGNLADTACLASLGVDTALDNQVRDFTRDGIRFRELRLSAFDFDTLSRGILYEYLKREMRNPGRLLPDILNAIGRQVRNRTFRTGEVYLCLTGESLLLTRARELGGTPFDWMPGTDNKVPPYFEIRIADHIPGRPFDPDKECACLDFRKPVYPLHFRHWQQGDRIRPLGMEGCRLVSDLFTDAHLSPLEKAQTWVVTDANGRIVWVSGLRLSEDFRVETFSHRVLEIRHIPAPDFHRD